MFEVLYEAEARVQFDGLPPRIRTRVHGIAVRLTHWPNVSGAKPLRGALAGHYRMRTGDYRVQFRAVGNSVLIERIGKRDRFYER